MSGAIAEMQDLTDAQFKFLSRVERDKVFTSVFFFTGGTLLKALGVVPRHSNDLDFFTFSHINDHNFVAAQTNAHDLLDEVFGADEITLTDRGFIHKQSGMTIDLVADRSPNIENFKSFGSLQAASLPDLAAHKASALCSRDEVKDYIDVAFLTKQQGWRLQDLERLAEKKFRLGTISEEKLLAELLAKREWFSIPAEIWLNSPEKNTSIVSAQIDYLIAQTSL